jgi:capsular exopolysaccharide synthesis family protein
MLLVGFITFIITPPPKITFKARSSVRVTESNTMQGLFVQAISYSRWNNLETQAKIIRSLPVVALTAQRMGLVDSTLTEKEIINSPQQVSVVNDMIGEILTQQVGKTDIIDIIITTNSSEKARLFANTLAEVFVEYSLKTKNQQVDQATDFIGNQLDLYKAKLEETENQLEAFKRENLDKISLADNNTFALQQELDEIVKERRMLELQLAQMNNRLLDPDETAIDWISEYRTDLTMVDLNSKLINLEIEKETLSLYQTPNSPEIMDLETQIQRIIKDIITEFDGRLEVLTEREAELEERLSKFPMNDVIYNRLQRELKINEEIYSLLRTQYQEARIRQSERIQEMSIVERATYALEIPEGGKWSKTVLGLIVGLLLGLVVAFIMKTLDTSIGAIQDVEEYLKTTVLGVIPHFDKEEVKARILKNNPQAEKDQYLDFHSMLVTQFRPKSPIAESYRTLSTNIDFLRLKREGANQFVITSTTMQEGKSTTIANLAIAMAQMGHRTLLVGCNLRRPTDYKIFGLDMGPGVKDISLGLIHWRQAVRNINDIALGKMSVTEELIRDGAWSRLNIITCGAIYHNPTEIFSTPKMAEFLRESKEEYDVVLIDCPPVLPVTDAAILGSKVDGVILVYQVGKIARGALKRAKAHLETVNAEVWGVILNDFKAEISGFAPDTAYYGKYYGGDAEEYRRRTKMEKFMMQSKGFADSAKEVLGRFSKLFRPKWEKDKAMVEYPSVESEDPTSQNPDENFAGLYEPKSTENNATQKKV